MEYALTEKTTRIPADIRAFWGKPPILRREDPEAYWQLADAISGATGPTCVIEWIQVKDVVDLTWEIIRLRQYKASMIDIGLDEPDEESETDTEFDDDTELDDNAECEADEEPATDDNGNAGGESEVDPASGPGDTAADEPSLEKSEADRREVEKFDEAEKKTVLTFLDKLDNWERIERLIAGAEIRRAAVLREFERQRSTWGSRLRRASDAALGGAEKLLPARQDSAIERRPEGVSATYE
jgi:hypothetical protein